MGGASTFDEEDCLERMIVMVMIIVKTSAFIQKQLG